MRCGSRSVAHVLAFGTQDWTSGRLRIANISVSIRIWAHHFSVIAREWAVTVAAPIMRSLALVSRLRGAHLHVCRTCDWASG